MYTFRELQKAVKQTVTGKEIRVAVLGNCATQFISQAIEGYAKLSGLNICVFDGEYDQMDQQLIDPESELYAFKPDVVVLWLAGERLYERFLDSKIDDRKDFAVSMIRRLEDYWQLVSKYSCSKIIQPNFTEINDNSLGNYSCKTEITFIYQIRKLNYLLQEAAGRSPLVYPVDLNAIQTGMGRSQYFSQKLYYSSKMPVSLNALPEVAKAVTDVLLAMNGRIKKCIVFDLDNTIWGGVIGDDGLAGIEIGEYGKGRVFTNLQRWLKQLRELGILLAVCSKNEEEVAREPFEKHEEMILRISDISVFVANWNDKASNIEMIRESLNIGMDSIVFLDDNPFERNLVKEKCHGIEVPELPEDPSGWLSYLIEQNYFEVSSYSAESLDRTKLYQAEYERKKTEREFGTIDEYLKDLGMIGAARPFEPVRYPRIAELTQRSNQFNLRTVRYTQDEIENIAEDSNYITLYYTLKDKYGDYGLVSLLIMKKEDANTLFIDTWLMSCRVLKRGMEEFVMNKMVQVARMNDIIDIYAEYVPTNKNKIVNDIYDRMGFKNLGDGKYRLELQDYKMQKTFVEEEE